MSQDAALYAPQKTLQRAGSLFSKLTIHNVLTATVFAALFALAAVPRIDVDLGWHLRTGQLILETGTIPHSDPYSFTVAGQPWITHEWLSEIIMYPLYANWGFGALIFFFAVVLVAGLWLVYRQIREDGVDQTLASVVLGLSAFAAMGVWGTRPLVFTLFLAPLYALLLRRWWRGDTRALLPLPFTMVVWVNLHGGYMFGLGLVAVYLVAAIAARWLGPQQTHGSLRALAIVGAACLLATLVNPNGYHILWYPFDTLTSEAMRKYLGDWPSPDFHQVRYWPFAIMLALFFISAARARQRMGLADLLLVLALAAMGLQSNRHVPLFAVIVGPVLARQLPSLTEDLKSLVVRTKLVERFRNANREAPAKLTTVLNLLVLLLIVGTVGIRVAQALPNEASLEVQREYFPADAVVYIRQNDIKGRIYNAYNWGGYLVLHLYPENRVFIDSRADVYRDEFIEKYLETYYIRPDWPAALANYAVDYVLVESQGPLHNLLAVTGDWQEIYRDDVAVLLKHTTPYAQAAP